MIKEQFLVFPVEKLINIALRKSINDTHMFTRVMEFTVELKAKTEETDFRTGVRRVFSSEILLYYLVFSSA